MLGQLRRPSRSPVSTGVARELSQVFFQLVRQRIRWFQRVAAELGLSPIQATALFHMDPATPSTMHAVADRVGCGASNLTGIVDKLEARGLVRRRAAPHDRRSKVVSMTRDGALLRGRLTDRLGEPAEWMLALPVADQRQLRDLLRKAVALSERRD